MVLSILIVVAAIASGIVGPEPATANVARAKPQKPHVRTITKTVTVHEDGGTITVTGSGDGSSEGDDDEHEDADRSGHEDGTDESMSDDAYEDDDAYEQEDEHEEEHEVEAGPQPEPTG
jgi:hypothetical protein